MRLADTVIKNYEHTHSIALQNLSKLSIDRRVGSDTAGLHIYCSNAYGSVSYYVPLTKGDASALYKLLGEALADWT